MIASKLGVILAIMGVSASAVANPHSPYDCQKQPALCQAYLQGVVDSLKELKQQSDMQDAFASRALNSRGGQRYLWARGQYCTQETYRHWNNWADQQQLLPEQKKWLRDQLADLNECR
ncbi:hypothetical protein [Celerinatantimonas sp. YJH-8]|uniref:hypothetical protein n=1 Tax=Celerinatantimonas sp. YJH-8 TaxID=3228714 RepID=UPI0038C79314